MLVFRLTIFTKWSNTSKMISNDFIFPSVKTIYSIIANLKKLDQDLYNWNDNRNCDHSCHIK